MKSDIYISQVQKIPEIETEVLWYMNKYRESESHPWAKFVSKLFLGFNIALPSKNDNSLVQLIIGLTILLRDYELVQGSVPGTYHIQIDEFGRLDEIEDVSAYVVYSFAKLVTLYYQANEKDETEKLENMFDSEIQKWNWHAWVKQEEVISLFGNQIKDISNKVSILEKNIPEVLGDYFMRINRKRLENLDAFIEKSNALLNSSERLKKQAHFFTQIIDEVNNGGINLKSGNDILPQYSGLKFN